MGQKECLTSGNFRNLEEDIEQQTKKAQDAASAIFANRDKASNEKIEATANGERQKGTEL